jgi:hypothetical protein
MREQTDEIMIRFNPSVMFWLARRQPIMRMRVTRAPGFPDSQMDSARDYVHFACNNLVNTLI